MKVLDQFTAPMDVVGYEHGRLVGVANGSSVEYIEDAIRDAMERGMTSIQLRRGPFIEYRLTLPQDRAALRDTYGIDVRKIEAEVA